MSIEWEDVTVAPGNFVKWETPGDTVTGWVVTYNPTAGTTDFNGDECGVLVIDDHDTRELRTVTLSLAALRSQVAAASPTVGLLMRITYQGDVEGAKWTYKNFAVQTARGVPAPDRPAPDELEEPFRVDAGEWMPGTWGAYPGRMLG